MTTDLIRQWTTDGAARESDGRFRSADELRAALAPRWRQTADQPLRMRRAGEEDWKPFLMGIDGDGERALEPEE